MVNAPQPVAGFDWRSYLLPLEIAVLVILVAAAIWATRLALVWLQGFFSALPEPSEDKPVLRRGSSRQLLSSNSFRREPVVR